MPPPTMATSVIRFKVAKGTGNRELTQLPPATPAVDRVRDSTVGFLSTKQEVGTYGRDSRTDEGTDPGMSRRMLNLG